MVVAKWTKIVTVGSRRMGNHKTQSGAMHSRWTKHLRVGKMVAARNWILAANEFGGSRKSVHEEIKQRPKSDLAPKPKTSERENKKLGRSRSPAQALSETVQVAKWKVRAGKAKAQRGNSRAERNH
jgi:hypothetical protein